MKIWNLGYPRLGNQRLWWKSVRAFERGEISAEALLEQGRKELEQRWKKQHELGLDSIPLNDFPFWDPLLDSAWLFGLVPVNAQGQQSWLLSQQDLVFGNSSKQISPLAIGRWFHTGYHCLLPDWGPKRALKLQRDKLDWELGVAKNTPYTQHLTLVGPWTLAQMTQTHGRSKTDLLSELAPLYAELLKDLKKRGLGWIQLDEPGFCTDLEKADINQIEKTYSKIAESGAKILIATYFDSPDPWLTQITQLPALGFHFDLVTGPAVLSWIKTRAFPKEKILSLGLVNAQNIWAAPLASLFKQVELLKSFHSATKLLLAPSAPLSFIPLCSESEEKLQSDPKLQRNISFANQRLIELGILKKALTGQIPLSELEGVEAQNRKDMAELQQPTESVKANLGKVDLTYRRRPSSFAKRVKIQSKKMGFPRLPLTLTSLPKGTTPKDSLIPFQEQYQMDVLLPDDLTFFERLENWGGASGGWVIPQEGWIPVSPTESIRPLIAVSDTEWKNWDSGKRVQQAQIQSNRVVKGVVVGAMSALNYAFLRPDVPLETALIQIALWVRAEIKHLESAGIRVIQVDEPSILDRLPLKKNKKSVFVKGLFDALKVALCGAGDETVIHLNLSQNDVETVKEVCSKCDVDLISFETDGLGLEKVAQFKGLPIECGVGPSIFPLSGLEKPTEKDIEGALRKSLGCVVPDKAWIIPDTTFSVRCKIPLEVWLQPLMTVTLLFRKALSTHR